MDQIKQLQYKIDSIRSITINESDEKWNEIIDALNSRIVLEQERAVRAECTATKTVQGERAHCSTRLNDMRDKHRKQMQSSHKIRKDQADCVVQLNKDFQTVKAIAKKKAITATKEASLNVKMLHSELDTARLGYTTSRRELKRKHASDLLENNRLKKRAVSKAKESVTEMVEEIATRGTELKELRRTVKKSKTIAKGNKLRVTKSEEDVHSLRAALESSNDMVNTLEQQLLSEQADNQRTVKMLVDNIAELNNDCNEATEEIKVRWQN